MSEYISDEFFHFVGRNAPTDHERNFQSLLAVIGSKCVSSAPPQIGWGPIEITLDPEGRLEDESLITGKSPVIATYPLRL